MMYRALFVLLLGIGVTVFLRSAPPTFPPHQPLGKMHDIAGVNVHITDNGNTKSDKRVLLLHGFGSHSFVFKRTIDTLTKAGYHAVTFDFHGFGHSDLAADAVLDRAHYTAQVKNVVEHLGWDDTSRPFSLLGFSMGGAVALSYTDMYPAHVSRLVLVGSVGFPFSLPLKAHLPHIPVIGPYLTHRILDRIQYKRYANMLHRKDVDPVIAKEFLEGNLGPIQNPATKERYARTLLSTLTYFPMNQGYPELVRRVGRHSRPVFIVWGDDDTAVPFSSAELFMKAMPKAKLEVYPGCGHVPYLELPSKWSKDLLSFLK